jgi:hypothetical protein
MTGIIDFVAGAVEETTEFSAWHRPDEGAIIPENTTDDVSNKDGAKR